jgi:hypothetical protein
MSNIITAKVKVKGSRPLFQHKFGPDAMPLEKQEKTGVAGHDPEEWRKTCMITKDGQLYIEGPYVFGSMREAAKFHKVGRRSAVTAVSATLQVLDDRILIDRFWPDFPNGDKFDPMIAEPPPEDPDEPVYMDIRGVRNPSTRARNVRYRICASPDWACEFSMVWDKTIVDRNLMHSILIDAGRLVGVGNGRAIGMGRFEVESFEIKD